MQTLQYGVYADRNDKKRKHSYVGSRLAVGKEMKAKVCKLSICQCGYPLFNDDVKIGTEYNIDESRKVPNSSVKCGGCGMENYSTFVWVANRTDLAGIRQMPGWIPIEAFDV